LSKFDIAVILLRAKTNHLTDLVVLAPELAFVIQDEKRKWLRLAAPQSYAA